MTARAHVYVRTAMDTPAVFSFAGGRVAVYTAPSPGRVGPNEDGAFGVEWEERRGVLAVADGVGGVPGGDQASALALETLRTRLEAAGHANLREAILSGFDEANQAVMGLGTGTATTLALARIDGDTVRCYHAGDSFVLVVGQRGRRKLETIAHSPVGYAVEAGLLNETEALEHEDRHVVSNLVGSHDMRIEMSAPLVLAPRDTLLVGSDGVSDNLHVEELVDLIRKGLLERVAATLARTLAERMAAAEADTPCKPDDHTFLLFRR